MYKTCELPRVVVEFAFTGLLDMQHSGRLGSSAAIVPTTLFSVESAFSREKLFLHLPSLTTMCDVSHFSPLDSCHFWKEAGIEREL